MVNQERSNDARSAHSAGEDGVGRERRGFLEVERGGAALCSEAARGRQVLVVSRNQIYSEEAADNVI